MKTIFFIFFDYIYWILPLCCNKKEIEKFEDPENWSNMGFYPLRCSLIQIDRAFNHSPLQEMK